MRMWGGTWHAWLHKLWHIRALRILSISIKTELLVKQYRMAPGIQWLGSEVQNRAEATATALKGWGRIQKREDALISTFTQTISAGRQTNKQKLVILSSSRMGRKLFRNKEEVFCLRLCWFFKIITSTIPNHIENSLRIYFIEEVGKRSGVSTAAYRKCQPVTPPILLQSPPWVTALLQALVLPSRMKAELGTSCLFCWKCV